MKPHIPVYHRPPNKFIRYEIKPFDDGAGHTATLRIAVFKDKHGDTQEMVAQVIWDKT
jgi:hypothetical protein